ncbi:hypothetical protein MBT84_26220 [Streptomyces sp. MBT84]|uniref:hypothetical protein n=1 Tax=unclassified Streptomyces TaxID=2593676 RepID=UPI001D4EA0EC|nr:hypothetical protein [Streptomyces sp. MBT84]MBW8703098.1 hypothetical protein [Streptomyces sp. MBT84]
MDVDELLHRHGVDTDRLDPAPLRPTWPAMRDHLAALAGCTVCGDTCLSTWVVDMGSGPRWVGLCRDHTPGVVSELAAPTVLGGRTGAVHG